MIITYPTVLYGEGCRLSHTSFSVILYNIISLVIVKNHRHFGCYTLVFREVFISFYFCSVAMTTFVLFLPFAACCRPIGTPCAKKRHFTRILFSPVID